MEHETSMTEYRDEIRNIRIMEYIKNYKPGDYYNQILPNKKFSDADMRVALTLDMPDKFMIEQLKHLNTDWQQKEFSRRPPSHVPNQDSEVI